MDVFHKNQSQVELHILCCQALFVYLLILKYVLYHKTVFTNFSLEIIKITYMYCIISKRILVFLRSLERASILSMKKMIKLFPSYKLH
ncbi:hypothetical protein V1477_015461 [Vespula maculifrons]|uniref:Uncharacterized protein n=1 Tax=Vespula maculifrons TaxID=7453 RepID=A0ABD2BFX2_VESMC